MKDDPLPPDVLADALQDRITPSSGRLRYSTPVTRKERRMMNERDRLRRLYENLLEVTDETAQQPVDVELALDLCRQLSSGRAALISDLDVQVATLQNERDDIKTSAEEYKRGLLSGQRPSVEKSAVLLAILEDEIVHLRHANAALMSLSLDHDVALITLTEDRDHLKRSLDLICEMAAQLTDPTALELIQDILHPEERDA